MICMRVVFKIKFCMTLHRLWNFRNPDSQSIPSNIWLICELLSVPFLIPNIPSGNSSRFRSLKCTVNKFKEDNIRVPQMHETIISDNFFNSVEIPRIKTAWQKPLIIFFDEENVFVKINNRSKDAHFHRHK